MSGPASGPRLPVRHSRDLDQDRVRAVRPDRWALERSPGLDPPLAPARREWGSLRRLLVRLTRSPVLFQQPSLSDTRNACRRLLTRHQQVNKPKALESQQQLKTRRSTSALLAQIRQFLAYDRHFLFLFFVIVVLLFMIDFFFKKKCGFLGPMVGSNHKKTYDCKNFTIYEKL